LANDYTGVQNAILEASPASMRGDLGAGLRTIAQSLAPGPASQTTEAPKRKFLEFFSV
jgi:hypothetical protein